MSLSDLMFEITLTQARALAKGRPKTKSRDVIAETLAEHLKLGDDHTVSLPITALSVSDLTLLEAICKEGEDRSRTLLAAALRGVLESPTNKVRTLKALIPALIRWLTTDLIDGWVYRRGEDQQVVAFLVESITYREPYRSDRDKRPFVDVQLRANQRQSPYGNEDPTSSLIRFHAQDVVARTVAEAMAAKGYLHESPAFRAEYDRSQALYATYHPLVGSQYRGSGIGFITSSDDKETDRGPITMGHGDRLVIDGDDEPREILLHADRSFWDEQDAQRGFTAIPIHPYLECYHLDVHADLQVHVANLTPYEYRPHLRDQLVLPDLHRDLVDILTSDMDVLMEDMVEGKSGGTTILCRGAPGLGKTLTAEVYAEMVKRPLYRVHSGQLGTSAQQVEGRLQRILRRCERWKAVLLLDEADVFVRTRGDDLEQNAVVAAFLRTLEYFHGLLFMTTNRVDEIDDAILSRCVAVISYERPTPEMATRIWEILAKQYQVSLSSAVIDELVRTFAKASGRDIRELLKLTSKFARRKGLPFTIDTFRQCAQFRNL
jgi:hypothetical protein